MEVKAGYKKTEVGIIPDDWQVMTLAKVCKMKSGESITGANIDEFSEYPCYGGNGLRGFTNRFTHDGKYALVGRQGALCGNVLGVNGKFFASEHAVVVTAFEQTDIQWLTYVLEDMKLNQYSESSAQPGLSVAKILNLDLAVPPVKAEQEAIAEALNDADTLIEALEQLLTKKRQVKQGAMQELLTGKRRLAGFENSLGYRHTEVGIIPEDWEVSRLSNTCKLHNGRAYALHEWETSGTPVIRLQNLTGGDEYYFSTLNLPEDKYCYPGDLLFMWSATFGPHIWTGERAIYHYHIWKVTPLNGKATSKYLFYRLFAIAEEKKARAANGGTMLHVTKSEMESTLITLPTIVEQTAIAEILSDMDAEIAALEAKLAKARQVKQGMMQELLTGRVRLV